MAEQIPTIDVFRNGLLTRINEDDFDPRTDKKQGEEKTEEEAPKKRGKYKKAE